MPDINLLLLGEPGVGKTTFINSFINYFWYDSVKAAGNSCPIVAAPMTVTYLDKENKLQFFPLYANNEKTPIKSNTKTKEYFITLGDYQVRLIDSPGLDVSRDQDQGKFRDIFRNLAHLEELHGVCFLLKSSLSRMNNLFEYYIRQTLAELDETIIRNFVFIFTNGRSTGFEPSTARSVLRGFVDSIKSKPPYVEIPLSRNNVFCVENEAFVNLIAVQCGAKLRSLGQMKRHSEESWDFSVKECKRLMEYLSKLKPYDFPVSAAVIEVQKFVIEKSYNLFTLFTSNYKNLEKCTQLRNEKEEVKSTACKQTGQQGNPKTAKTQSGAGAVSKNPHNKNAKGNKGSDSRTKDGALKLRELEKFQRVHGKYNPSTSGQRTDNSVMGYAAIEYSKYLDQIQSGVNKMNLDDGDNKVDQLAEILKKQRQFFGNIFKVVSEQQNQVHKILKRVAEFSVFLKKNRIDDAFENQASELLSVEKGDNNMDTAMILDEMLQYYRSSKFERRKNRTEEVGDEDVQEVARRIEQLENYQDVFNNILN